MDFICRNSCEFKELINAALFFSLEIVMLLALIFQLRLKLDYVECSFLAMLAKPY